MSCKHLLSMVGSWALAATLLATAACDDNTAKSGASCVMDSDCAQLPTLTGCDSNHRCNAAVTDGGAADHPSLLDGSLLDSILLDLTTPDFTLPDLAPMCTAAAPCSDPAAPICDGTPAMCRACQSAADDVGCRAFSASKPRCNSTTMACVECLTSADCSSTTPVCDVTANKCVPCTQGEQCSASLVCASDGSCAPIGDVVYVDNMNGACGGSHSGLKGDPDCEIQKAVDTLGSKHFIHVAPSTSSYASNVDVTRSVVIVGSRQNRPMIAGKNNAFHVHGGTTVVVIDGFDITASMDNGVLCDGMGTMTVIGCKVHDCTKTGISAMNCTLTVDASNVTTNQLGGISVNSTDYTMTNNFIAESGRGPGVTILGDGATGVASFQFNTVAYNSALATQGGIQCLTTTDRLISASIVVGNSQFMSSQIASRCKLMNVVTGPDMFAGAVTMLPTFIALPVAANPGDYHLKAGDQGNQNCCFNMISTGPGHDIDFAARPIGTSWEIGADEVQ